MKIDILRQAFERVKWGNQEAGAEKTIWNQG